MSQSKNLVVPKARDFGWELKPTTSAYFEVIRNRSNQICVVLEHALLRGVTTEMLFWWFRNFTRLKIQLTDVPGYEGQTLPAYLLWHPSDHISARLKGKVGPEGTARTGAKIHIQEVMQYEKYQLKYPVDQALSIFYHEKDGWGMGKKLPLIGPLMVLRISFKDVYEGAKIIGVHYHYEVVAGSNQQNLLAKKVTKKIVGNFGTEFWEAWLTHNVIEVGVFENFLPVLFEQRHQGSTLSYSPKMNPVIERPAIQKGFSRTLFEERVQGYTESNNGFLYQGVTKKSFL
ncbi:MAG: hypothetical protein AAF634_09660 [Bacteroidota bacterium]